MRYLLIALFLISCGDESEIIYPEQLPPPIPPTVVYEPPQTRQEPPTQTPRGPTHQDCVNVAKRQYPWIRFQEGSGTNAFTQIIGYRRAVITMGYQLKQSVDAEQYCLILNHEISHAERGMNELVADYYGMQKLRYMLQRTRGRYDDRNLDRIAMKQYRWLSKRPPSRTHPHPRKRLRVMRKAIKRQKMNKSDYY